MESNQDENGEQEILEINACSEDEFIKMVGYIIPDIEWLIYLKNIYRRESIWKMEEEHIYDYQDCMDVIGNNFDNPELLEV